MLSSCIYTDIMRRSVRHHLVYKAAECCRQMLKICMLACFGGIARYNTYSCLNFNQAMSMAPALLAT